MYPPVSGQPLSISQTDEVTIYDKFVPEWIILSTRVRRRFKIQHAEETRVGVSRMGTSAYFANYNFTEPDKFITELHLDKNEQMYPNENYARVPALIDRCQKSQSCVLRGVEAYASQGPPLAL